jgi:hypothetical protein
MLFLLTLTAAILFSPIWVVALMGAAGGLTLSYKAIRGDFG